MEFADKILSYLERQSEYCEVRFIQSSENYYHYNNGKYTGSGLSEDSGYAVRVQNGSISMGFFNDDNFDAIRDKLDAVIKKSRLKGKNKIDQGGGIRDAWRENGKKAVTDFPDSEKIDILKSADALMDNAGASLRMNALHDRQIKQFYINSSGTEINSEYSRIYYVYNAGVYDSGSFEETYNEFGYTGGYENLLELNLEDIIKNDIKSIQGAIRSHRPEPGKYDVVIGPDISGIAAHESAGHPMEYDRISGRESAQAGESFIRPDNYPLKIGSSAVNIIDDPNVAKSFGYYKYDDEGIRAKKRYLYKNGYTSEFILNRESAGLNNSKSNGGGRSSDWDMEPLARMSTTYLEPGDYTFDELIEDIRNGIYIKNYTEWNIDDIRFNEKYVGREAYIIKNGKIMEQVRRPVIETNTVKFYTSMDAVGNDLKFSAGICGKGDPEQGVDVWMGGPHARLRNMYIK
ncbi:peptidase [Acidiplasma aeolicum]|uniref:Peptidase n=1 Tax=Acidiplasma aeolicum TaxID=507754 RepID=A0A0Q1B762_9ARCH|nr:TldD/PmbA family protein [Acidiplasma aeolicum]KPV46644.1 peptidase [Acidiplasma aeolicum]KQB35981.1 peptidase [Acidiplasma aeolicum]